MKFASIHEARIQTRTLHNMVVRAYEQLGADINGPALSEQQNVDWNKLVMFGDTMPVDTRMASLGGVVEQLAEAQSEVKRLEGLSNITLPATPGNQSERSSNGTVTTASNPDSVYQRMVQPLFTADGTPAETARVQVDDTPGIAQMLNLRAVFNTGSYDPDVLRQNLSLIHI